jgi:hypothetical protein
MDRQFRGYWIGRRGPVEWPPRSSGLTPLDFDLWGHLKATVCQVKTQYMDHLKECIRNACARITLDVLTRVRHERERCIRMCYHCNGTYIEHVL